MHRTTQVTLHGERPILKELPEEKEKDPSTELEEELEDFSEPGLLFLPPLKLPRPLSLLTGPLIS